ncbi:MAG TPA: extracellular solute-binding protein [Acetobacteraceae bacterium]|nr:extracellular solute-binding protein [Acetobacteraceae bacterium]
MGILHYQKALLEQVGFSRAPQTFAELQQAAIACTKAGAANRFGLGYLGRQGPALVGSWSPYMRSNGGSWFDPKTHEILVNQPPAVESLQFWGDLMTKYHTVVPDCVTWEFDEIVAGGQNDRYAMAVTLAPYGTLINDPKLSKTGGRWAADTVPGGLRKEQSRTTLSGWTFAVPNGCKNTEWAWEFIQFATSKEWMRRSIERGNAPPRVSVLNDPAVREKFQWAPVAAESLKTATLDPRDPVWPTLELRLRVAVSEVLLGQKTAKDALDGVARDRERAFRRAGVGR